MLLILTPPFQLYLWASPSFFIVVYMLCWYFPLSTFEKAVRLHLSKKIPPVSCQIEGNSEMVLSTFFLGTVGRREERGDVTVTLDYTLLKRRKYCDQLSLNNGRCTTVAKSVFCSFLLLCHFLKFQLFLPNIAVST